MKKILLLLLLPFFCFANSVGENNNDFAMSLFSQFEDEEENLAFSPYGIFSNLSLLYYGAKDETAQQIKNALHLSATGNKFLSSFHKHLLGLTQKAEHGYQLSIANALFPHQGTHFLHRFKEIATENFDAQLQAVDYAIPDSATRTINNWVEEKTKGKIKEFIEKGDITKETRLITVNAVYFQGDWVHPFQKEPGTFHLATGESKQVDMLYRTHNFPYYEDEEVQCLALPFVRGGIHQPFLECLLVLPKKDSLPNIEKSFDTKKLDQILYALKSTGVDVHVPKFCFSKKIVLNDLLKKLGMQQPFTYRADFSKIDGMKDLFLNRVLHETYFSFHEHGVTAASATSSQLGLTSVPREIEREADFTADHPFLFFLVDYHSRAILFMGRVNDPTTEGCDEN